MNLQKYSRQILFSPIGVAGQEKLRRARVVIVGCGALGTAQAGALVRAGVSRVRIIDRDFVEPSNLQRQVLFDEADAAASLPKAVAAARHLRQINSEVEVEPVVTDLDAGSVLAALSGFDLILDGTDNFETRYLLNDAALELGIPWIYAAVVGSYAATLTVLPGRTACLACVFPEHPQGPQETCETAGVISPAVAWAAAIQTAEALKILIGRDQDLHGKLLAADLWLNSQRAIRPQRDPNCRACGQRRFTYLEGQALSRTTVLCGRNAVQIRPPAGQAIDLASLSARLSPLGVVSGNEFLLRWQHHPYELTVFVDGRAIVKGTDDPAVARRIHAQYIGT